MACSSNASRRRVAAATRATSVTAVPVGSGVERGRIGRQAHRGLGRAVIEGELVDVRRHDDAPDSDDPAEQRGQVRQIRVERLIRWGGPRDAGRRRCDGAAARWASEDDEVGGAAEHLVELAVRRARGRRPDDAGDRDPAAHREAGRRARAAAIPAPMGRREPSARRSSPRQLVALRRTAVTVPTATTRSQRRPDTSGAWAIGCAAAARAGREGDRRGVGAELGRAEVVAEGAADADRSPDGREADPRRRPGQGSLPTRPAG